MGTLKFLHDHQHYVFYTILAFAVMIMSIGTPAAAAVEDRKASGVISLVDVNGSCVV